LNISFFTCAELLCQPQVRLTITSLDKRETALA
jgi:hypothetical protein